MDQEQPNVYGRLVARYEALCEEGKITLQELTFIKSSHTIEDVLKEATKSMAASGAKRNEQTLKIISVGLEKFERISGSIQIMIQADPTLSALVVGSLNFFMNVARDVFNALDRAVELFEVIAVSLQRFNEYLQLFPQSKLLQNLLQQVYVDIVDFCLEALKFYDRGKARTFGAALWKSLSGPFDALLKRIDRHVKDIDNIAKVEEMKMNKEGRDMVKDVKEVIENLSITRAVTTILTGDAGKIFRVPAILHPKFTGRKDAIEGMQKFLLGPKRGTRPRRVAIYGLPGAGKTQLALKYAHENRKHYPQVFHAFAATRERLAMEYEKWVCSMDLRSARGFGDQDQKVDAMKNWFQNHDNWLLILDNVAGCGTSEFAISDFLPPGSTGTIIFTTRNEFVAKRLAPDGGAMLLERMDPHDAIDLILQTAGIEAPTEEIWMLAKEIQEELGGLPIALEQAGTAINDLDGTLTPQAYLDRLRSNKVELLAQPNGFSIADSNTVSATFNGVLKGCSPDAVLLLELFSFLDPEGIPTDLLREGIYGLQLVEAVKRRPSIVAVASPPLKIFSKLFGRKPKKPEEGKDSNRKSSWKRRISALSPKKTNPPPLPLPPSPPSRRARITSLLAPENATSLENAIRELKSSSLLRLNRRDYWIHDLVREFALQRLQPDELDEMLKCVIDMVAAAFPLIDSEDQRTNNCNKYRTTARAVILMTDRCGSCIDTPTLWELKHRLARHFLHLGLHDQAEPLAYVAYERRKKAFGETHELTLASASLLGNIWARCPPEGGKVIPFWEELCAIAEKERGPLTDFTLECKRILCICYRRESFLNPAEHMIREQIALITEHFGERSEMGLRWRNDLTIVLHLQEKFEEANRMSLEVWKDCFETLGNDHKLTVSAFETRAGVLVEFGRMLEVAGNQIIAFRKNTAIYGTQHPDSKGSSETSINAIWTLLTDPEATYDAVTLEAAVTAECRRIMEFTGDRAALAEFESYEALVKKDVEFCVNCQLSQRGDDQQADSGYEEGAEEPQKFDEEELVGGVARRNSL